MKFMLIVLVMAMMVGGCAKNATEAAREKITPAHHAQCREADFDHAALQVCAVSDSTVYYSFFCVDKRGEMHPFEDKTND